MLEEISSDQSIKQNLTLQEQTREWQVELRGAGKGLENRDKQFLLDAIKREEVEGEMLEVAGQQQNIGWRDSICQGQKHAVTVTIKIMRLFTVCMCRKAVPLVCGIEKMNKISL